MLTELNAKNFDEKMNENNSLKVIEFYSESCPMCQIVMRSMNDLSNEDFENSKKVSFYKVCISKEENSSLTERFQMRSVPKVIITRNGKDIYDTLGVVPSKVIKASVERFIKYGL